MSTKFIKRIENFTCAKCKKRIKGTGYTNHCPNCLWSKHVDINPGDRASDCKALMAPVWVSVEKGKYILTHQCEKCGLRKRNKMAQEDNFDQAIKIIEDKIKKDLE